MFFELHDENKIGYKELNPSDSGRSETSHQTHIGLFGDVFTFLPNSCYIKDAMVIYEGKSEILPLHFDRIGNPDGTYRSPKIRAGKNYSIVSFIRNTIKRTDPDGIWYLFWFGLKSEQPVFMLFNKNSRAYYDICSLGIELKSGAKGRLDPRHPAFQYLIDYLEHMVNVSGYDYAEKLELAIQTGTQRESNVRRYNFEKALARHKRVGREGEKLVDIFFSEMKAKGEIADYTWINRDSESGMAYDFWVEETDGKFYYLDVKTTDYRFEQKMVFSNQEIDFASANPDRYCVYRVYCDEHGDRFFKICTDVSNLFISINVKTNMYKEDLVDLANVQNIKLSISPCHEAFEISEPISLQ